MKADLHVVAVVCIGADLQAKDADVALNSDLAPAQPDPVAITAIYRAVVADTFATEQEVEKEIAWIEGADP